MSTSRNALLVSPRVTFKSPEQSISDSTPALIKPKSENDDRGGAGTETKGLAGTAKLSTSRSAITLTPRVTFKSLAVAGGTPFASSPLVSEKTPERDFGRRRPQARVVHGVDKGEIRKDGAGQGLSGGDSAPGPMRGVPGVSPAAVEPKARTSAGKMTTVVASTGESCEENGAETNKGVSVLPSGPSIEAVAVGALDTSTAVAQTAANGHSGATSTVSRSHGTRRESVAGSLASRDSPTKPTTCTRQEARISDTSNTTSPPDMNASLFAVEGVARGDSARIAFLPREATAQKIAGEESPFARLYREAARSSENKRESHEVNSPDVRGSDQDMVGSGAKPTERKVGTPGIMGEGGTPSTLQKTMVRARKYGVRSMLPCRRGGVPTRRPREIVVVSTLAGSFDAKGRKPVKTSEFHCKLVCLVRRMCVNLQQPQAPLMVRGGPVLSVAC